MKQRQGKGGSPVAEMQRLKSLLYKSFGDTSSQSTPCDSCKACETVVPGSVTPHNVHVLIRLSNNDGGSTLAAHLWWPERVDDHPAILAVTTAIKEAGESVRGPVKVTAFDYPMSEKPPPPNTFDVLIFPTSIKLTAVPLADIGDTVVRSLTLLRTSDSRIVECESPIDGLSLVICCHAKRDARCGYLGPKLAKKLEELGAEHVFLSSHVGGHQYAGNVISYGSKQPSAGTWFGGLSDESAAEFYAALTSLDISGDPAMDSKLRRWWRGRVGPSKEEQAKHFHRCTKYVADIEDAAAAAAAAASPPLTESTT